MDRSCEPIPRAATIWAGVLRHAALGYSCAMGLSKAQDNLMTRNVCPVACGLVTWELTLHNKIRLSTPVAARTGTGRLGPPAHPGGSFCVADPRAQNIPLRDRPTVHSSAPVARCGILKTAPPRSDCRLLRGRQGLRPQPSRLRRQDTHIPEVPMAAHDILSDALALFLISFGVGFLADFCIERISRII
jgi:hypothetical protein